MQITYTVQPADFDALSNQLNGVRNQKSFFPMLMMLVAIVMAASFGLPALIGKFSPHRVVQPRPRHPDVFNSPLVIFLGYVLPLICFVVFYFLVIKSTRSKTIETNPDWSQPRVAEITPEHLINRYASGESSSRWSLMKKIVETETHIFFLVSDTEAHLVPKRAFASEDEAKLFARTAATFWEKAHGIEIKAPLPDPRDS